MINTLVAKMFSVRNAAHLAHFKTQSYAQHVALGDFYEKLIDATDELVECYQGEFGLINVASIPTSQSDNITGLLETELGWLKANREEVCKGDDSLENLFDAISAIFQRTIYKLENLH